MLIRLPDAIEANSRIALRTSILETLASSGGATRGGKLPPSGVLTKGAVNSTLEERLFNNRATLKILTSQISMHLHRLQREDLFKQLDSLLDLEAWAEDSSLVWDTSFLTFLRFLTYKQQVLRPALTVSPNGNIMATWLGAGRRLTIEFQNRDMVRTVAHLKPENDEMESLAYVGPLRRLDAILEPFGAVGWYREAA